MGKPTDSYIHIGCNKNSNSFACMNHWGLAVLRGDPACSVASELQAKQMNVLAFEFAAYSRWCLKSLRQGG